MTVSRVPRSAEAALPAPAAPFGPAYPVSWSDTELLAVLLGSVRGRPGRLAAECVLEASGWTDLVVRGEAPPAPRLAPSQRLRLEAVVELATRAAGPAPGGAATVRTPRDVYELAGDFRAERREHFVGFYLNARSRLLGRETVSVGSLNASIVHPREVFEPALRRGAAQLVVAHNHPSGETDPSDDDVRITRRLAEAGELLGIPLMDHVIVGANGFTSLREQGLL